METSIAGNIAALAKAGTEGIIQEKPIELSPEIQQQIFEQAKGFISSQNQHAGPRKSNVPQLYGEGGKRFSQNIQSSGSFKSTGSLNQLLRNSLDFQGKHEERTTTATGLLPLYPSPVKQNEHIGTTDQGCSPSILLLNNKSNSVYPENRISAQFSNEVNRSQSTLNRNKIQLSKQLDTNKYNYNAMIIEKNNKHGLPLQAVQNQELPLLSDFLMRGQIAPANHKVSASPASAQTAINLRGKQISHLQQLNSGAISNGSGGNQQELYMSYNSVPMATVLSSDIKFNQQMLMGGHPRANVIKYNASNVKPPTSLTIKNSVNDIDFKILMHGTEAAQNTNAKSIKQLKARMQHMKPLQIFQLKKAIEELDSDKEQIIQGKPSRNGFYGGGTGSRNLLQTGGSRLGGKFNNTIGPTSLSLAGSFSAIPPQQFYPKPNNLQISTNSSLELPLMPNSTKNMSEMQRAGLDILRPQTHMKNSLDYSSSSYLPGAATRYRQGQDQIDASLDYFDMRQVMEDPEVQNAIKNSIINQQLLSRSPLGITGPKKQYLNNNAEFHQTDHASRTSPLVEQALIKSQQQKLHLLKQRFSIASNGGAFQSDLNKLLSSVNNPYDSKQVGGAAAIGQGSQIYQQQNTLQAPTNYPASYLTPQQVFSNAKSFNFDFMLPNSSLQNQQQNTINNFGPLFEENAGLQGQLDMGSQLSQNLNVLDSNGSKFMRLDSRQPQLLNPSQSANAQNISDLAQSILNSNNMASSVLSQPQTTTVPDRYPFDSYNEQSQIAGSSSVSNLGGSIQQTQFLGIPTASNIGPINPFQSLETLGMKKQQQMASNSVLTPNTQQNSVLIPQGVSGQQQQPLTATNGMNNSSNETDLERLERLIQTSANMDPAKATALFQGNEIKEMLMEIRSILNDVKRQGESASQADIRSRGGGGISESQFGSAFKLMEDPTAREENAYQTGKSANFRKASEEIKEEQTKSDENSFSKKTSDKNTEETAQDEPTHSRHHKHHKKKNKDAGTSHKGEKKKKKEKGNTQNNDAISKVAETVRTKRGEDDDQKKKRGAATEQREKTTNRTKGAESRKATPVKGSEQSVGGMRKSQLASVQKEQVAFLRTSTVLKIKSNERNSAILIPLRRSRVMNGKVLSSMMMDENGGIVNKAGGDKSRDSKSRSKPRDDDSVSSGDDNVVRIFNNKDGDTNSKKTQSDTGSKLSSSVAGTGKRSSNQPRKSAIVLQGTFLNPVTGDAKSPQQTNSSDKLHIVSASLQQTPVKPTTPSKVSLQGATASGGGGAPSLQRGTSIFKSMKTRVVADHPTYKEQKKQSKHIFTESVLGRFTSQQTLRKQGSIKPNGLMSKLQKAAGLGALGGGSAGGEKSSTNVNAPPTPGASAAANTQNQKTLFQQNPSLASLNLNTPAAPQGRRRFVDYFNEIKQAKDAALNNVAEADNETESLHSSIDDN